ncbi:unnamed protein product [Prunus armeniaca]|uniref:SWIRM domain-containing protein n=1 Tax=Prunus armeniaca TaxID=36596 RepID=A0A6J5TN22_PRUAR|nr:unnamed protein product [Prunus armeniaca]
METTDPSDNLPNDVVFDESSPETDLTLSGSTPHDNHHSQNHSSENPSAPPRTTLDAPISDSQDDSSEPIPEGEDSLLDQRGLPNPAEPGPAEPGPPAKRRRRRKKFFTELNSTPSLAKNRRTDLNKDVDVEALIAISVGFPVDSLTEEEIEANVVPTIGGVEQANYIVVRNHILARWRSNVSFWLTRELALESIRLEHKGLVDSAYDFLVEHGYINFGLAPAVKEAKLNSFDGVERGNVVIVGAGFGRFGSGEATGVLGLQSCGLGR